jgi:hypothetical protein
MSNGTFGSPIMATASGTSSAVATVTGIANSRHYVTDIAGSTDKAGAIVLVKDGTTVIWQVQIATTAAGNNSFQQTFRTPLACSAGNNVSITVDGTSVCKSNISGFTL